MLRSMRRSVAAALLLLVAAAAAHAHPPPLGDCDVAYPPPWGSSGKDVPWLPTSDVVALAMLSIAQVTPSDLVLDLGAGDGRIAVAAAKAPFRARAVGIEYDSYLAKRAQCLIEAEGVSDRVRFIEGDVFEKDFGAASVVTMYLLPEINLCLRHRLLALEPGTRIVSHQYAMADWVPDRSIEISGRAVHLWVVPAHVDGVWEFRDSQGTEFRVDLHQTFGALSGDITRSGLRTAVAATLRGAELRLTFDAAGDTATFSGTVRGDEITGLLSTGTTALTATGQLHATRRAAPWAQMPASCARFYDR